MPLKKASGNWVSGDRFWDREHELSALIQHLEDGANVLLIAQRRFGKTSLMHETSRRIQDRFLCLHVDLQKGRTPADAIAELSLATRSHTPLWDKTKLIFSNLLNAVDTVKLDQLSISIRAALTAGDWQPKGSRLFEILSEADRPVVLFLDEVPVLVNRILKGDDYTITPERRAQAEDFLSWLRASTLQYQGRVRTVVTGSIGFEPILKQAGISATLNHFTSFELGPWSRESAAGCLRALANSYSLSFEPDAIETMLDHLGLCVPHHVQVFFEAVYQHCLSLHIRQVPKAIVSNVYAQRMLSIRGHVELSHFEERLRMVLGPDLHPLALDLLTEAAVANGLTEFAARIIAHDHLALDDRPLEQLRQILTILEHDGYLNKAASDRYIFASRLLRDWWNARFSFAFTPVSRRSPRESQ